MDTYDYGVVELRKFVDGDTLEARLQTIVEIDIGFRIKQTLAMTTVQRLRLLGVDTPEKDEPGYGEASAFSRQWLTSRFAAGALRARTEKQDSFGRWLADLYDSRSSESLGAALVRAHHAVPFMTKE
jgi:endonuclease YncB( thermonuclease family)